MVVLVLGDTDITLTSEEEGTDKNLFPPLVSGASFRCLLPQRYPRSAGLLVDIQALC